MKRVDVRTHGSLPPLDAVTPNRQADSADVYIKIHIVVERIPQREPGLRVTTEVYQNRTTIEDLVER